MKKLVYTLILATSLIVSGCTKKYIDESSSEISKVIFKAEDFKCLPETKVYPDDNFKFLWAEDDTVGIYPDKGSQIFFAIGDGAQTGTATFDGGGWHFNSDSKYYSYYPFDGNVYLDRHKVPVDFDGQKQIGADGRTHVGSHWYMYTPAVSCSNGSLTFSYKHLSILFSLRLKLPAGTYTKVTISSSSKIFVKEGYFDLQPSSGTPAIIPTEYTDSINMDLENVSFESESEFKAMLTSAPVDLSGVTLTISVFDDQNKEIKCIKTLDSNSNYTAGTVCQLGCTSNWKNDNSIMKITHSEKVMQVPNLGNVEGTVTWIAGGESETYSSSLIHNYDDNTSKTMTLNWNDGDGFEIKELSSISNIELTLTE